MITKSKGVSELLKITKNNLSYIRIKENDHSIGLLSEEEYISFNNNIPKTLDDFLIDKCERTEDGFRVFGHKAFFKTPSKLGPFHIDEYVTIRPVFEIYSTKKNRINLELKEKVDFGGVSFTVIGYDNRKTSVVYTVMSDEPLFMSPAGYKVEDPYETLNCVMMVWFSKARHFVKHRWGMSFPNTNNEEETEE